METQNQISLPTDNSVKKIGNKQYAIVLVGALFLFATGLILYSFGFFNKEEKPTAKDSLSELTPPPSKKTQLTDDKYKNGLEDRNNGFGGTEELTTITGKEPSYRKESNETLSQEDFEEVKNTRQNIRYNRNIPKTEAQRKKEKLNQDFQRKQNLELAQQRTLLRNEAPIFKKTAEELEEERMEKEEKELNRRTAQLVLSNLEKVNKNPSYDSIGIATNRTGIVHDSYKNPKKLDNDSKNIDEISLHPETAQNTMGNQWKKGGFYNFSNNKKQNYYSENDAIEAVIHGQGEAITVRNGFILKLRLLQNTVLQINEKKVVLPAGTLLPASCQISEDRVIIQVKSLRVENAIYPLSIAVFDLDGQQGLYVPKLKEKNVLSRELSEVATLPFNGTSVFVPSGSIGNQVGTQMALQSAQGLMQGAKGYFRSKIQSPKVTIKHNYKVLLKSVSLSNQTPQSYEE